MTDLEKDAAEYRQQKLAETKLHGDRSALRTYMAAAASGLISSHRGGYISPEDIANSAADYARALLKKEVDGF